MSQIQNHEYFIEDPQLPKLFMQSWSKPNTEWRGCALITHGISEHSECYSHVGEALAEQGWFVYAWDLEGHGKSDGKRGYIRHFEDFNRDLVAIIGKIKEDETKPVDNLHLVGHSMGGLITLNTLMKHPDLRIQSVVLSNPALGLALEVPKVKEVASHWLNQLWPTLTLSNEIRYERLSRDPQVVASYSKDPLRHNKVSAPLFLGMNEAMEWVTSHPEKLKCPSLFQVSGQDQVINPQVTLDFFKKLEEPHQLKLYEESYHEIYNDLNKQQGIDDLIQFLGE